jgi:hypothetical protein
MIKVKHPLPHCNVQQEELIATCPEDQRRFHILFFNYGNATYRYHNEAKEINPSLTDFKEWLEGLPDKIRADMEKSGFEYCKNVLSFTRYVNEKNDIGMDQYVRNLMGDELYTEYRSLVGKVNDD